MSKEPRRLAESFVHLGLAATAVPQPPFEGGVEWYDGYGQRHGDLHHRRRRHAAPPALNLG
jgi:hypothetical protein